MADEPRTAADVVVPEKAKAVGGEGVNLTIVHDLDADTYGKLRLRFPDGNGELNMNVWTDDGTVGAYIRPGETQGHGLDAGLPFRITKTKEGVAIEDEELVMMVCFSKSGKYNFSDCMKAWEGRKPGTPTPWPEWMPVSDIVVPKFR